MEPYLLSLFTFFAGLFLGHHLALGRDKRKEFNELARPIREWLLSEINDPHPMSRGPAAIEVDAFTAYLPARHRAAFRNAHQLQAQARKAATRRTTVGDVYYEDTVDIKKHLAECFKYTEWR